MIWLNLHNLGVFGVFEDAHLCIQKHDLNTSKLRFWMDTQFINMNLINTDNLKGSQQSMQSQKGSHMFNLLMAENAKISKMNTFYGFCKDWVFKTLQQQVTRSRE